MWCQTGFGEDFKQKVNSTIGYIGNNLYHFQKRYKEFRLFLVDRFPYIVYYLINEERGIVIIFSVLHMKRDPEIAQKRIK